MVHVFGIKQRLARTTDFPDRRRSLDLVALYSQSHRPMCRQGEGVAKVRVQGGGADFESKMELSTGRKLCQASKAATETAGFGWGGTSRLTLYRTVLDSEARLHTTNV